MFKSNKFKKIEFKDNKKDYTIVLSKMEQNVSSDNTKAECGKLTGSVYRSNDQIKYIAAEAVKYFYIQIFYIPIYILMEDT